MRFNPPDSASADPRMGLSVFNSNDDFPFTINFQLASGFTVGTKYQTVVQTGIYRFGGQSSAQMRITKMVPATLSAATPSMSMNGNIQDFSDVGCDISFLAVGVSR